MVWVSLSAAVAAFSSPPPKRCRNPGPWTARSQVHGPRPLTSRGAPRAGEKKRVHSLLLTGACVHAHGYEPPPTLREGGGFDSQPVVMLDTPRHRPSTTTTWGGCVAGGVVGVAWRPCWYHRIIGPYGPRSRVVDPSLRGERRGPVRRKERQWLRLRERERERERAGERKKKRKRERERKKEREKREGARDGERETDRQTSPQMRRRTWHYGFFFFT